MATSRQRRISAAIILATLAFSALLLAQGTTRMVAAALIKIDPTEGKRARRSQPIAQAQRRADARKITTRNIFDLRGDLEAIIEEETASDEPLPENPDDPNSQPRCTGGMRLVGAIVNPGYPEWSFAAISSSEGKSLLYRRGSSVDGSRVVSILPSLVVMQPSSGSICQIAMFDEGEEAPKSKKSSVKPADKKRQSRADRNKRDKNAGLSDEELDSGIQKISDSKYNIARSMVDKMLGNQASLMRVARVIPQEEDGRVVGVKLYGVRRNSLLGRLGVQNGDMLRTINGYDMSSPDSALEAYARLRSADKLTLTMTRRGKPQTIEYNIQ